MKTLGPNGYAMLDAPSRRAIDAFIPAAFGLPVILCRELRVTDDGGCDAVFLEERNGKAYLNERGDLAECTLHTAEAPPDWRFKVKMA